jgi:tRNA(Ile)-lysidine synthase
MASSRKRRSAEVTVALSGGVDSVVLLHRLSRQLPAISALHVHHGLSPNADAWARFCRKLCRRLEVPLTIKKVKVARRGNGLEAAARDARYRVLLQAPTPVIALAHNLDDQAETVLMNLLRGAGARGASGMPERGRRGAKTLWRPLLGVSRKEILAYARRHELDWVEDESNADQSLTRNFIRRRVGPILAGRFPRWKEALARAARLFSKKDLDASCLLRSFLSSKGLRAPSEAKLTEMLRQLTSGGARTKLTHDGAMLRVYRGKVFVDSPEESAFSSREWKGQRSLALPGGELRFRRRRGNGFEVGKKTLTVRARSGGERLQPDARRPRRTLKNLFQEARVPPWQRDRLPMLFDGDALVWVPGLGVDARFQAAAKRVGWVPEWRPNSLFLRKSRAERAKISR